MIKSKFRFEYKLIDNGWADCIISDGEKLLEINKFSYISDTLGDLLIAAADLLYGHQTAYVEFNFEPGQYRMIFNNADNIVNLKVLAFKDNYSMQPDREGNLIYEIQVSAKELITSIYQTASDLLIKHGEEKYKDDWRRDFPIQMLDVLKEELEHDNQNL